MVPEPFENLNTTHGTLIRYPRCVSEALSHVRGWGQKKLATLQPCDPHDYPRHILRDDKNINGHLGKGCRREDYVDDHAPVHGTKGMLVQSDLAIVNAKCTKSQALSLAGSHPLSNDSETLARVNGILSIHYSEVRL